MRAVVVLTSNDHDFDETITELQKYFVEDRGAMVYLAEDEVAAKVYDVFNEQDRLANLNPGKSWTKKPITIEAMQYTAETAHDVYLWAESCVGSFDVNDKDAPVPMAGVSIDARTGFMVISTLEGIMQVKLGDFVIKGIQGEFYPCKPDIFMASYSKDV